ncbi:MAG: DNA polymerase [Planctomycetota bacterium]|jgi:DNA polymerase-1|nr:DNA polymerase [Planctomycetota bacterium]
MSDGHFVIIDGHYFCYRFFFGRGDLRAPDGRPTNVTFAFAELLTNLRRDPDISHWALIFDHPEPSFRHRLFPDYKAQRPPMPDDLRSQLADVECVADAMGIPRLAVPGVEADDVIAGLAVASAERGLPARICTRDKDIDQVLSPLISTWDPLSGQLRGPANVYAERGVGPEQVIDYLTMVGDSADNVPGIRGIGPKTASALLQQYGSLDGVYQHIDDLRGKRRENVEAFRERFALTRELITICAVNDLPSIDSFAKAADLPAGAATTLAGFGFVAARFEDRPRQADASDGANYTIYEAAQVEAQCQQLRLARHPIAIAPVIGSDGTLRGCAVSAINADRNARYLRCDSPSAHSALAALLADAGVPTVLCQANKALRELDAAGIALHGLAGDPALAAWLLNPEADAAIAALADRHLNEQLMVDPDAPRQACTLAQVCARLEHALSEHMDDGLNALYREQELPALAALVAVSSHGIGFDHDVLDLRCEHASDYLQQVLAELRAIGGERFNPLSPSQVAELLFIRLGLPVLQSGRDGAKIDDATLRALRDHHDAVDLVLQFRELSRLLAVLAEPLGTLAKRDTQRLHVCCEHDPDSGHLARSEPNLDELPSRSDLGRELRDAFRARTGTVLLSAGFSDPALHLLARLAKDQDFAATVSSSNDPYRHLAANLHRCELAAISPSARRSTAAVVRAIATGMSAFALGSWLGVPRAEAAALYDEFLCLYPGLGTWCDGLVAEARQRGHAETITGRRRRIAHAGNDAERVSGNRLILRWTIEGSLADMVKRALVTAVGDLPSGAAPVLALRDELVIEAPLACADACSDVLHAAFAQAWPALGAFPLSLHRGPSLLAAG